MSCLKAARLGQLDQSCVPQPCSPETPIKAWDQLKAAVVEEIKMKPHTSPLHAAVSQVVGCLVALVARSPQEQV